VRINPNQKGRSYYAERQSTWKRRRGWRKVRQGFPADRKAGEKGGEKGGQGQVGGSHFRAGDGDQGQADEGVQRGSGEVHEVAEAGQAVEELTIVRLMPGGASLAPPASGIIKLVSSKLKIRGPSMKKGSRPKEPQSFSELLRGVFEQIHQLGFNEGFSAGHSKGHEEGSAEPRAMKAEVKKETRSILETAGGGTGTDDAGGGHRADDEYH
jgi:hypothetical protein